MHQDTTLYHLPWIIQDAVKFENDHPFCFYVARIAHGRRDAWFTDDGDFVPRGTRCGSLDTTLVELYPLPRDRKLFYWFDFGDD